MWIYLIIFNKKGVASLVQSNVWTRSVYNFTSTKSKGTYICNIGCEGSLSLDSSSLTVEASREV